MNFDLSNYDIESLKTLYETENDILQARLLNGEPWEQVKAQKAKVVHLSKILHQRLHPNNNNPAEFPGREGS